MSLLNFKKMDSEVEFLPVFFPKKGHKLFKIDEVLHLKKFVYANLQVRRPPIEAGYQHPLFPHSALPNISIMEGGLKDKAVVSNFRLCYKFTQESLQIFNHISYDFKLAGPDKR